jgi:hypothetical protein
MPSFSSEPKAMYSAKAQSTVRFLVMSARPRRMRESPAGGRRPEGLKSLATGLGQLKLQGSGASAQCKSRALADCRRMLHRSPYPGPHPPAYIPGPVTCSMEAPASLLPCLAQGCPSRNCVWQIQGAQYKTSPWHPARVWHPHSHMLTPHISPEKTVSWTHLGHKESFKS